MLRSGRVKNSVFTAVLVDAAAANESSPNRVIDTSGAHEAGIISDFIGIEQELCVLQQISRHIFLACGRGFQ